MSKGAHECSLLSFHHDDMAGRSQLGHFSFTGLASAVAGMKRKASELETDGRTKNFKDLLSLSLPLDVLYGSEREPASSL